MREVAVHFEDVVVPTIEGEAEPSEVGRAQTELALAFDEVDAFAVRGLRLFDEGRGAVRRAVIDHQHVKRKRERHHRFQHALDVFPFVVRGDDDQAVVHVVIRNRFNSSRVRCLQWPRGRSFLVNGP